MTREIVLADFFSGCGGTARGFADAGVRPVFATDWDEEAVQTFKLNFPDVKAVQRDIRELATEEVVSVMPPADEAIRLLAGCAPCQPFAGHRNAATGEDKRSDLVLELLRFVEALCPQLVFVENVPGMRRASRSAGPFMEFVEVLKKTHRVAFDTISCADYGVPQTRRRLVLIASSLGEIDVPTPTHGQSTDQPHVTVRDAIHSLPHSVNAPESSAISSHRAMRLTPLNRKRIKATPEGGDRRNWPKHLWPDCHRAGFGGHTDVYGRLSWDKPAPTLTTKCISYSNGRFGHPSEHRAITAREAARLQTFHDSFEFAGGLTSQARQIGNAVPVLLARRFGQHFVEHVAAARARESAATSGQADRAAVGENEMRNAA
ncbi:MAG: DNA cytosine methyltransferase [Acidimicrobiaceae bacterium]|nr:DNA cytosine methyltransferase [Acidimicrobiaceae bacterium]